MAAGILSGMVSAQASDRCFSLPEIPGASESLDQLSEGMSLDDQYQALKKDYLGTGMCDPAFNYAGDRRLALLASALSGRLSESCSWGKPHNPNFLLELKDGLGLSTSEVEELNRELSNCAQTLGKSDPNPYYLAQARYRVQVWRVVEAKFRRTPETLPPLGGSFIYRKMAELKMIQLTENGTPDCEREFVSYDAFQKAMRGFRNLKKSGKMGDSRYLTIVDYSKPSNSRRMMVLDLKSLRVVNQTWVAHGGGTSGNVQKDGADGFGSRPMTGNESESNLSSLGFIKASGEYTGKWGRSLNLQGLESGINDQMLSRRVVLHGWGVDQMSWSNPEDFNLGRNRVRSLDPIDQRTQPELNSIDSYFSSMTSSNSINSTQGCLGVSMEAVPVRQVDGSFQGVKNQRDLLIELLGGNANGVKSPPSLIFNYGGPDQKSVYF
jgi:hypothetical protein